jgi:uncharacterized protein
VELDERTIMIKYLLLIAVLGFVLWYFFRSGRPKEPANPEQTPGVESFVVCAQCHLRLPESDAINFEGRHYCCEEHRRQGPA